MILINVVRSVGQLLFRHTSWKLTLFVVVRSVGLVLFRPHELEADVVCCSDK